MWVATLTACGMVSCDGLSHMDFYVLAPQYQEKGSHAKSQPVSLLYLPACWSTLL